MALLTEVVGLVRDYQSGESGHRSRRSCWESAIVPMWECCLQRAWDLLAPLFDPTTDTHDQHANDVALLPDPSWTASAAHCVQC
jgi:hypothetical protein